ncbi:unnamed protein product [Lymnaea stagnalis]|uniref:Poly [ADP-ribose] polymerase n=1 Tax=Lymnaea stagnalis TaxID=6523 RepID=A0AAV2HLW3_LYMST
MASNKESRKIVLMNIPSSYDAELVKDYIEGTLDIDVMEVNIFPYIPGRALATLKDDLKDFSDAAQLVADSPIEGNKVALLETFRKPAIVVNELNIDMLSEDFLKLYLENTFADGEEVIQGCQTWPDHHLAAVNFSSEHQTVVDEILNETDHTPLPSEDYHIKISHFYCNFHEFIGQQKNDCSTSVKSIVKAFEHSPCENNHPIPIKPVDTEGDSTTEEDEEDHIEEDEDDKLEDEDDDDQTGGEGDSNDIENDDGEGNGSGYKNEQSQVIKICSRGRGFRGGSWMTHGLKNVTSTPEDKLEDDDDDYQTGSEGDSNDFENDDGEDTNSGYKNEQNRVTKTCFRGLRGGSWMTRGKKNNVTSRPEDMIHKVRNADSEHLPLLPVRGRGNFRGNMWRDGSQMDNNNMRGRSSHDMGRSLFSRQRGSGNSRGRQSRKDGILHIKNRGSSNNWSKERKNSFDGNEFSGMGMHRTEEKRRVSLSLSRERLEDDYEQPSFFVGGTKPDPKSGSQPYLGPNQRNTPSCSRGGRGGSSYVWQNAGQSKQGKFLNKFNRQEERLNGDNNERAFNEASHYDISKPFVSDNASKFGQSQEASEEKNKELLKQLEEEKAKQQDAKTIRGTLEITLLQAVFLKPSFNDFKDCMIHFDSNEKVLVLYGTDSAIRDCQMKLMLEMKKIKEETIAISSDMKSILSREKGKKYIKDLNSSGLDGAKVELDDRSLLLAAKEENVLSEAVKMLKCKVDFIESVKSEVAIPNDRLTNLKYGIEHSLLVQVTFDDSGKIIKLLGIEDDVLMARRDVEKLFEEYGVYEKSFNVGEPEARFLHLCCEDRIKSVLKSVDVTELTLTETKVSIRYKGSKSETHQVHRNLLDLKNNVLSKNWNLFDDFKKHEIFLIAKSLKNGQMKEKLETYKYREKILVIPKFPDLSAQLRSSSMNKKSPDKTKRPKSSARDSRPVPQIQSQRPPSANKLVYDISNTCQLVIKPYGDIIKEKSDILVSILGPEMDMRKTRVGGTFNKTCPSHWKELQLVKDSNPGAPVLTVKNPKGLNCLAVCHVILAIWNPSSSQQLLNVAIQTVLNEAKNLGAKTISFPALGCGRAFQFPPLNVAQQVVTSIRAMNVGSFLNKVTLLAPDNELFKEFKSEVPKHFNAALPKYKAAPTQPAPPAQLVASDDSEDESDDNESSDDAFEVSNLNDTKNASNPQLTIITLHGNKTFEAMKKIISQDIREQCLHSDYFNQKIMKHWPRESRQKILKEAMKLSVWAERSIHPKTKHVGFQLIGEKPALAQIKAFIHQEFLEESSHLPKRSLTSDKVPKRGTVDFMRYAADSDELFPSYWSLNKSKKFWSNLKNRIYGKEKKLLVEVDKETKDAVTKLVTQTLDIGLVGQGNDAAGINYSSLKVLDVKRVENAEMFERYRVQRKRLFDKMVRKGKICPDIGKLKGSKGRVCTTELLSDSMKKELYYEVNEHYLFHGTKSDTIEALIHNGLDPRLSNEATMFGKGIYAAERATKSDQYTDSKQQRTPNGTKLTLILTRMLLGNVFLCDDKHKSVQSKGSKKLSRPPCMSCLEDFCKCRDQTLFDSVMGDGKWLFREFVVYESSQCYPEYVITYTRV